MGGLVNRSSVSRLPNGSSLGKLCWIGIAGNNNSLQGMRIFTRDSSPPFCFSVPNYVENQADCSWCFSPFTRSGSYMMPTFPIIFLRQKSYCFLDCNCCANSGHGLCSGSRLQRTGLRNTPATSDDSRYTWVLFPTMERQNFRRNWYSCFARSTEPHCARPPSGHCHHCRDLSCYIKTDATFTP